MSESVSAEIALANESGFNPNDPAALEQAALDASWEESERVWEEEEQRLEKAGWPLFLRKALRDPFDYAACVRGLGIVRFEDVEEAGKGWVRLRGIRWKDQSDRLPFPFDRGVEVRLSNIVWVADAPEGS
jgi:hypothetical protein